MNDLVSVIIPCFNQAHFLPEAVESALNQTWAEVEVVVVNDGSPDETARVAESYGERVRYVPLAQNRGLAAARNAGLAAARGDFIQFLDADDIIYSSKLAKQVALLKSASKCGACLCDCFVTDMTTGSRTRHSTRPGQDTVRDILCGWEKTFSIPIHTALFRRSIWNGPHVFNERMQAREDWVMWCYLVLQNLQFKYTNEVLCEYRLHKGSMCQNGQAMCHALINAAVLIKPIVPFNLQDDFDNRLVEMLCSWLSKTLSLPSNNHPLTFQEKVRQQALENQRLRKTLQVLERLVQWQKTLQHRHRVVIFGAAELGRLILQVLDNQKIDILLCFDNFSKESTFHGIEVCRPKFIPDVYVLLASLESVDMQKQVIDLGFTEENVLNFCL